MTGLPRKNHPLPARWASLVVGGCKPGPHPSLLAMRDERMRARLLISSLLLDDLGLELSKPVLDRGIPIAHGGHDPDFDILGQAIQDDRIGDRLEGLPIQRVQ